MRALTSRNEVDTMFLKGRMSIENGSPEKGSDNMDIRFPNLNLVLDYVGTGITIFGFEIRFYGVMIALGFLAGLCLAQREAKRTGQDPEIYLDYLLIDYLFS